MGKKTEIDRAARVYTLRIDGQQLNVVVEALRQFDARNPGLLRNGGDNLKNLRGALEDALSDSDWNRRMVYGITL